MNQKNFSFFAVSLSLSILLLGSCKGRSSETTTADTTTTITAPADNTLPKAVDTAIVISADDSLKMKITDATKDFPGVSATVDQGVITVTGEIKRTNLSKLMMSLNSLHPKKINNKLTIK